MFFGSRDYHLGLKNSNTAFCFPQLKIRKPNYDLRAKEFMSVRRMDTVLHGGQHPSKSLRIINMQTIFNV